MAGSFSISKYARALPSLLALKERGQGPHSFSDEVTGQIDLTPLYLLQDRETFLTNVVAAPVVGTNNFTTVVPANEIWYVHQYFVGGITGGATSIRLCPACNFDGQATPPLAPMQSAGFLEGVFVGATNPFWATPGSTFAFLVGSVVGATGCQGGLVVTKLRV